MPNDYGHDDTFVFNNIVLSIPPTQINIQKRAHHYQWDTLRSSESQIVKSGKSELEVTLDICFVGVEEWNTKLVPLIDQIRICPFVYTENKFLRDNIFPGIVTTPQTTIALAIRRVLISTESAMPDTARVKIQASLFNYKPYSPNFMFRRHFFDPAPVRPWESDAFRDVKNPLYKPLLSTDAGNKLVFSNYSFQIAPLASGLALETRKTILNLLKDRREEFLAALTLPLSSGSVQSSEELLTRTLQGFSQEKGYTELSQEPSAEYLKELEQELDKNRDLKRFDLKSEDNITALVRTLSKARNTNTPTLITDEVIETLLKEVSLQQELSVSDRDGWSQLKEDIFGRPIEISDRFASSTGIKMGLFYKQETLSCDPITGLIPTDITVVLNTRLATIPLVGYNYPTSQYIGGCNEQVIIGFSVTNDDALKGIQTLYESSSQSLLKAKQIPQHMLTLSVNNGFLNSLGLKSFFAADLLTSTIENQKGFYRAEIALTKRSEHVDLQEKLTQEYTLSNDDLRARVIHILFDHVRNNGIDTKRTDGYWSQKGMDFQPKGEYATDGDQLSVLLQAFTRILREEAVEDKWYLDNTISRKDDKPLGRVIKKLDLLYRFKELPQGELFDFFDFPDSQREITKLLYSIHTAIQSYWRESEFDKQENRRYYSSRGRHSRGSEFVPRRALLGDDAKQIKSLVEQYELSESFGVSRNIKDEILKNYGDFFRSLDSGTSEDLVNLDEDKLVAFLKNSGGLDPDLELKKLIREYFDRIFSFADVVITGGFLSLPEFKSLKDASGRKRGGKTCYPDLPWLEGAKNTLNPDGDISVDPDFYFYSETQDTNIYSDFSEEIVFAQEVADSVRDNYNSNVSNYFWKTFVGFAGKPITMLNMKDYFHIAQGITFGDYYAAQAQIDEMSGIPWIRRMKGQQDLSNTIEGSLSGGISSDTLKELTTTSSTKKNNSPVTLSPLADAIKHLPVFSQLAQKPQPVNQAKDTSLTGYSMLSPVETMIPTSVFLQPRDGYLHQGLDLASANNNCPGVPIRACDYGRITFADWQVNSLDSNFNRLNAGAGYYVVLEHLDINDNPTGWVTRYFHMEPAYYSDAVVFHKNYVGKHPVMGCNIEPVPEINGGVPTPQEGDIVKAGQVIGFMGNTGHHSTGVNLEGVHLHLELAYEGVNKDPKRAIEQKVSMEDLPDKNRDFLDARSDKLTHPTNLMELSANQLVSEYRMHQGYRMIRAFPTFKLYFIEEDQSECRFEFDDFFSYSSVQEISLIRDREICADLLHITLTNISGNLSNRRWSNESLSELYSAYPKSESAVDKNGKTVFENIEASEVKKNTLEENPVVSMLLKVGMNIQFCLGYSNDPAFLEPVFHGKIAEIQFSSGDDLIEIVCQSHAAELEQDLKGIAGSEDSDHWYTSAQTKKVFNDVLTEPEVEHFGYWDDSPGWKLWDRWFNRRLKDQVSDNNIFAPDLGFAVDFDPSFCLTKTTIWEVAKELELRHPGWVALPVPYEGARGPRMTMFFGIPSQLYYCRDDMASEVQENNLIMDQLNSLYDSKRWREDLEAGDVPLRVEGNVSGAEQAIIASSWDYDYGNPLLPVGFKDTLRNLLALRNNYYGPRIKPFRSYHLVTSEQHIVANNIQASQYDVYNTISVQYSDGELDEQTGKWTSDDEGTLTTKADILIEDKDVQEAFAHYQNCYQDDLARAYGLSLLKKSLRDVYKGELIILGNPCIKPYDIVFIADKYNQIYGAVEVAKVVHLFSQESGFITSIKPDLIVTANELDSLACKEGMAVIAESILRRGKFIDSGTGFARVTMNQGDNNFLTEVDSLLSLSQSTTKNGLGIFALTKMMSFTSNRDAIIYSPLLHQGRPMMAGLALSKGRMKSWWTRFTQWFDEGIEGIKIWADVVRSNSFWEQILQKK